MYGCGSEKRFWSHVDRKGDQECWPWTASPASLSAGRYGSFQLGGKTYTASRVAFYFSRGHWPEYNALHTCDNKACCNPAHLYDGTKAQNVADAVARGQHPRGLRHGRSKLDEDKVRQMRQDYAAGTALAELARRYGVVDSVAGKACKGQTWKHVI